MGSDRTEEFMYTGLLLSLISRAGSIANKKQVFYFMRRTVWNTFLADYTASPTLASDRSRCGREGRFPQEASGEPLAFLSSPARACRGPVVST